MADFPSDAITDVLDRYDIIIERYYTDNKNRTYYVDLGVYALPIDDDFCFTVAMDPKDIDQSFVNGFCQYAHEFDPDEHPKMWIPHHRYNLSNSLRQLLDDSDTISEFLDNVGCDLQKALIKTKELEIPTEEEKADSDGLSLD